MAWPFEMLVARHELLIFALVLGRVAGLTIGAPLLTGISVPLSLRAILTATLALVLVPTQVAATLTPPTNVLALAEMLGRELLVGLALGLAASITIAAVQMAGAIVGQLSGMSLAEAFDPCFETEVPVLAQFMTVTAIALFMLLGGQRLLIEGLLDSFAHMPPGLAAVGADVAEAVITVFGDGFTLAARAAAPAVASLLIASLTLAAIGRALPQLTAWALGFGLNTMAALGGLWLSLGTIAFVFDEQLRSAVALLLDQLA